MDGLCGTARQTPLETSLSNVCGLVRIGGQVPHGALRQMAPWLHRRRARRQRLRVRRLSDVCVEPQQLEAGTCV